MHVTQKLKRKKYSKIKKREKFFVIVDKIDQMKFFRKMSQKNQKSINNFKILHLRNNNAFKE